MFCEVDCGAKSFANCDQGGGQVPLISLIYTGLPIAAIFAVDYQCCWTMV